MNIKKITIFIVVLFMVLVGIRFIFTLNDIVDISWNNSEAKQEESKMCAECDALSNCMLPATEPNEVMEKFISQFI